MSQPKPSSIPQDGPTQRLQELLQSQLPPRPFWDRCLQDFVKIFRAEAGTVWWLRSENDSVVISSVCGRKELQPLLTQRAQESVAHVFQAVATHASTRAAMQLGDDQSPAGFQAVCLPVCEGQEVVGAIELIFPETFAEPEIEKSLASLQQVVARIEQERSRTANQQTVEPPTDFWPEFEKSIYRLHRSLRVRDVADVAVNDALTLIQCDRISLAVRRGHRVRIIAVSGQDHVNWRSEQVRSLTKLAEESVKSGQILNLQENAADLVPEVSEHFVHHIEQSGCRQVVAVPLRPPAPDTDDETQQKGIDPGQIPAVGCLIFEQFHDSRTLNPRQTGLYELCDHVALGLFNAIESEQIFLRPTRRMLGRGLHYFRGRRLALACLILSVLTAVSIALAAIPAPYRVEAEGRLMPVTQRQVFAPWDGVVVDVADLDGITVQQGDTLLTIHNDELHADLVAVRNQLQEKQQAHLSLDAQIDEAARGRDRDAEIRLRGQREELRAEILGLEQQLEILTDRERSLTIKAPIDGVVATFQIREKLLNRPVTRGELLLEVMDDSSPDWRLELQVPENRMGHLLRALAAEKDATLPVEYVLATDAERTYPAKLTRDAVATRSEIARESGTIVQVYAEVETKKLPTRRIGAEATGKIDCGRRSLAYVLFGDVWEFLQRFFWL